MESFLENVVGKANQVAKIVNVTVEKAIGPTGMENDKLMLEVETEYGRKLRVDDAWYRDSNRQLVTHGLWVKLDKDGKIHATSTIALLMTFLKAATPRDLIGKDVVLYPKKNNYLAIIATNDFDEDKL